MADPEIEAMSSIATALDELDPSARARVLRWAAERFDVAVAAPKPPAGSNRDNSVREGTPDVVDDADEPEFEYFADLFDAAAPASHEDKALVAGYWFQIVQGKDKFKASELQSELKHLGHQIPNITEALTSNIKKKPARVLQLAKSGTAKQARKTYKVTREGEKHVLDLIQQSG